MKTKSHHHYKEKIAKKKTATTAAAAATTTEKEKKLQNIATESNKKDSMKKLNLFLSIANYLLKENLLLPFERRCVY